jgi:hypothetical protein
LAFTFTGIRMVQGGGVTELKADRSLMDTEQLAEDEIRELARDRCRPATHA